MRRFDVRPADPTLTYSAFSGGNQQKLMLAKWLQLAPAALLLDEPTQGVDVGARQQIFGAIHEIAAAGTAVVCASADHEQLAAICSRVLVFGRGRVHSELRYPDISRDAIVERCYASAEVVHV
jgi:ribose transport system ATP-binding protein